MGQAADALKLTLPASTRLVLESVERTSVGLAIRVHGRCRRRPPCAGCGCSSVSRHGHYERELTDVPWIGCRVKLLLKVRRFRCGNARCARRTFTEQLPGVAAPWGRATLRLSQLVRRVGYAAGGRGGSRLLRGFRVVTSGDTILRRVTAPSGLYPTGETVLGLWGDDWAS